MNKNRSEPLNKYPYGLKEEEIQEAFEMHDKKMKIEVIQKLEEEYPLLLNTLMEDDSVLNLLLRTIEISITNGMASMSDHKKIIKDYIKEKEKDNPFDKVTRYEFEKDKGVSGVLLPNGEFKMCGNAEHNIVAEEIEFKVQMDCLYFSSDLKGKYGAVTVSPFKKSNLTEEQTKWVEENMEFLNDSQRSMYRTIFKKIKRMES